jgi:small-conductance mechanosensitive channel
LNPGEYVLVVIVANVKSLFDLRFATLDGSELRAIFKYFHHPEASSYTYLVQYIKKVRNGHITVTKYNKKLLNKEGMNILMPTYTYFPLGNEQGYLIPVDDALSFADVRKVKKIINKVPFLQKVDRLAGFRVDYLSNYLTDPEHVRNFIESCAVYSVICYLLKIGQRHNDNIMVTSTGENFRILFCAKNYIIS